MPFLRLLFLAFVSFDGFCYYPSCLPARARVFLWLFLIGAQGAYMLMVDEQTLKHCVPFLIEMGVIRVLEVFAVVARPKIDVLDLCPSIIIFSFGPFS